VPKRRANEAPWEARLREAVRAQHPFGYSIREMKGKVSIQRYWQDTGKRESASLPLEWHPTSQRELLNALHGINAALGRGLSLKEAVKLTFDVSAGPSVRVNWTEVLGRFRTHKLETGAVKESTWLKEYEPRLRWLVDCLNGPAGANNGESALKAVRVGRNGQGGELGSRGRKLRIQYAAQLLRFAVEKVGLDQRWLPPDEAVMRELIGQPLGGSTKAANAGQARALRDDQFMQLLDSISNPRWRLAIGLVGEFGLRGVELNYCSAREDGLWVQYRKNTVKGATKPRLVPILDPQDRPGLGSQLLLTLGSGIVELPPLGSSDAEASGAISVYLRRNEVWKELKAEAQETHGERISVYSLRHLFAWRCAMASPPVNPRAAAAAMGHSFAVHVGTYSQQFDMDGVLAAFAAANNQQRTAELHTKDK
jgi:integrase